jgi:hypothetical protein
VSLPFGFRVVISACKEINFVNHELIFLIKTGYIQTNEGGVNTQYKSNKKQKMGAYAVKKSHTIMYHDTTIVLEHSFR